MTDICDSPSDDGDQEGEADAPAVAITPRSERLPGKLVAWLKRFRGHRHLGRLHRLNDHMLGDIGLTREDEDQRFTRYIP